METIWATLAICSAAMLLYVYIGYPLLICVIAGIKRSKHRLSADYPAPSVSIVISTRDTANDLRIRLENCLTLEYSGKVEILIGADDSQEAYETALEFAERGVNAYRFPRLGKASVQNRLIREAKGQIIVTTDTQTRFAPDFLCMITAPFADPTVGGATGVMKIINKKTSGTADTEANYWSYEQWLRAKESAAGILLSVVGACFAFRKHLYREIGAGSDTDNLVPMQLAEQGYSTSLVQRAAVLEEAIDTTSRQLKNRTRSVTRSFADYCRHPRLLNPFLYPRYALVIWSHKLLRWLTPYFALILWVALFELRGHLLAFTLFAGATAALALSIAGLIIERFCPAPFPITALANFLVVNIAFLRGTINAALGKRIEAW